MSEKKYDVIIGDDKRDLVEKVNKALEEGFIPLGGVTQITRKVVFMDDICFAQAVINNNV